MTLTEAIRSGKKFRLKNQTNWFPSYDSTMRQKITLIDVPYSALISEDWETLEAVYQLWSYKCRETGKLNGIFYEKPPRMGGFEVVKLNEADHE